MSKKRHATPADLVKIKRAKKLATAAIILGILAVIALILAVMFA